MGTVITTEADVRAQLDALGIGGAGAIHRNLAPAALIARSLARAEGILAANGALVVKTGEPSGRSPQDRFLVDCPEAADVSWGAVNKACSPALFEKFLGKARGYLHDRDLYVFDGFAGAERNYRLPVARRGRCHVARAVRDHPLRAALPRPSSTTSRPGSP